MVGFLNLVRLLRKIILLENSSRLWSSTVKIPDTGLAGFGEAYFSKIREDCVKAWKRHREMILNLVVPFGEIRFVIYDDRFESQVIGNYFSVNLSIQNYQRQTVPPMARMGFQGVGDDLNFLLNIAVFPMILERLKGLI
jgi:dTDP-4-dehydrorhamnose 3,5-epimerase